jgi:predicted XRE-type DNA-binding protein
MKIKDLTNKGSNEEGWLEEFYEKRVSQNRDLTILITDSSNERGTGKTTLACKLAERFDRTEEGLTTEKATHSPTELKEAYTNESKGSSLILDEAEASMSKYRASSGTNKAIRDLISQGRVLEKYTIFSAPASGVIDTDLKSLFDVWILVLRRGEAIVHYCDYNPYKGHSLFKNKEHIKWEDLDTISWEVDDIVATHQRIQEVYDYLTEDKKDRLHDRNQEDEEEEGVPEEVRKEARNEMIKELYENTEMTQKEVSDAVDLSRSHVANLLSE